MLQKYPDNLSVQVLNGIGTSANSMAEATTVRTETENRRVLAMRDMDKSARAPVGDLEFGADWAKLSEEQKAGNTVQKAAEDKAILEAAGAAL